MNKLFKSLFLSIIVVLIYCCKNESARYYPPISNEKSIAYYNKYKTKLDTAYSNNDRFEIGLQLANLGGDKERIFEAINNGIKDNEKNCKRIFDWYKIYVDGNFKNKVVRLDINKFIGSYQLCHELYGRDSYQKFIQQWNTEYEAKQENRPALDSAKFDYHLIKRLDEILKDDQKGRAELYEKEWDKDQKKDIWVKTKKYDSINLKRFEKIIAEGYEYPGVEEVGYDHQSTLWLVLHHQSDLEVRMKYDAFLSQAVDKGRLSKNSLTIYRNRTNGIKSAH